MCKKQAFKTRNKMFISRLFKTVLAEETTETQKDPKDLTDENKTTDETAPIDTKDNKSTEVDNKQSHSQTTINYEDLITRARKEEKSKLYPKISQLEKDNESLVQKNNTNLITIEEKEQKIKELEEQIKSSNQNDSEQVKDLKKIIKDLENKIKDLEDSKIDVEDIEKTIKEQYDIKLYRLEKIHDEGNNIIPELVTGTTKEEIDASITASKARFSEIQENILKTNKVTIPNVNIDTSKLNTKEISMEELSKMNVASPEYKEMRAKLGLK